MLVHEKRFFAAVIDVGIVLVLSMLIDIFIPNVFFGGSLVFLLIYFIVNFIYMGLCLLISKDKTIGLYSMSLKLLGKNWDKVNNKTIFIRLISHGIPVFYLVNILYMLLNKSQVTFFDELSDSFIVKTGDVYDNNDTLKRHSDNKNI